MVWWVIVVVFWALMLWLLIDLRLPDATAWLVAQACGLAATGVLCYMYGWWGLWGLLMCVAFIVLWNVYFDFHAWWRERKR